MGTIKKRMLCLHALQYDVPNKMKKAEIILKSRRVITAVEYLRLSLIRENN